MSVSGDVEARAVRRESFSRTMARSEIVLGGTGSSSALIKFCACVVASVKLSKVVRDHTVANRLDRKEARTRVYSKAGSITCFHNPSTTTRWTFSSCITRLCRLVVPETEDAILLKPGVAAAAAAAVCRVAPTV